MDKSTYKQVEEYAFLTKLPLLIEKKKERQKWLQAEKLLTLCDKEVEHGKNHSVATEHVVTTCMHSRQRHPKPAPDGHSSLQFGPHVTVNLEQKEP